MPSPEHEGQPPEEPKEPEPTPYYSASRYQNERPAQRAYMQAQQAIYGYKSEVDLSAYRFLLNQLSHVAVIGSQPPEELEKRLQQILASGEATTLPEEILTMLMHRRSQASQIGPWVEGHDRPGRRVYPPDERSRSPFPRLLSVPLYAAPALPSDRAFSTVSRDNRYF